MMRGTQVNLDPSEHSRARRRAGELGLSLTEYIRRLVREDFDAPARHGDVRAIFGLRDSGGSDVAREKDRYVGEAFESVTRQP